MCNGHLVLLAAAALLAAPALAGEELRDPMRPPHTRPATSSPVAAQGFRVSAIFVSDARRIAVLNGKTVTIGDRVDGATITSIGESKVTLAYQGRAISAELKTARIRE